MNAIPKIPPNRYKKPLPKGAHFIRNKSLNQLLLYEAYPLKERQIFYSISLAAFTCFNTFSGHGEPSAFLSLTHFSRLIAL